MVCAVIDVFNGGAALFMEMDAEDTALPRVDTSVLSVVLMTEFMEINVDTVELAELEIDEIDALRVPTSAANAIEN